MYIIPKERDNIIFLKDTRMCAISIYKGEKIK